MTWPESTFSTSKVCPFALLRAIPATGKRTKCYVLLSQIAFPRFPEKWKVRARVCGLLVFLPRRPQMTRTRMFCCVLLHFRDSIDHRWMFKILGGIPSSWLEFEDPWWWPPPPPPPPPQPQPPPPPQQQQPPQSPPPPPPPQPPPPQQQQTRPPPPSPQPQPQPPPPQ